MRGLEALAAARTLNQLQTAFQREVALSSGGKHAGKVWSCLPRFASQCLDNDHFRMGLRLRLGLVRAPDNAVCQIPCAADAGDLCLNKFNDPVIHPHVCKCGPARLRPHRFVQVRFRD